MKLEKETVKGIQKFKAKVYDKASLGNTKLG